MLYRNSFVQIFRLLLICLSFFSTSVLAATTHWISSPEHPSARVRLLLSGEVDSTEKQVIAGLQVLLESPWKTYWRSPGEAGIAPAMNWQEGNNFSSAEWLWPVPERFDLLGIQTLGYQGDVVFPLLINVSNISQPVELNGTFRLSSCTTICVLSDFPIQLSFTPDQLKPDPEAAFLIDKAMSRVPAKGAVDDLSIQSVNWNADNSTVTVTAVSSRGWNQPDIILDGLEEISFSRPEFRQDGNTLQTVARASSWLGEVDLSRKTVSVTLINDDQAIETTSVISDQPFTRLEKKSSLPVMILFGLLGGFILNFMPCVLPVLGLKLSSVIQSTGQNKRTIRGQFLSSAFGILVSFWLLALFLLILKWTGSQFGWGIQFQNPWFIGFMALITGLFAANLLGAFEIQLPSGLNTRIAAAGNNNLPGHFVQGMFATLLATPCSAPFLGTAVAFALTTDVYHLFAIFTAMGTGLAMPYLLVALYPSVMSLLPKPGAWMIKLRRILAVLLVITTLWLVSLLEPHLEPYIGTTWQSVLLFGCTVVFIWLLLKPFLQQKRLVRLSASLLAATLVSVALGYPDKTSSLSASAALDWQTLDTAAIQQHVAEGKTVFVDVTADWCVTCKTNKVRVLDRNPVLSALKDEQIILMRGDWTTPSNTINRYLEQNDRFGVPFNKVYRPDSPRGVSLPVILDHNTVLKALAGRQADE